MKNNFAEANRMYRFAYPHKKPEKLIFSKFHATLGPSIAS
jgi:hypothetical protein